MVLFCVQCCVYRKRLSSPRCRSELIDSAWVVIVPGQKMHKKEGFSRNLLSTIIVEIEATFLQMDALPNSNLFTSPGLLGVLLETPSHCCQDHITRITSSGGQRISTDTHHRAQPREYTIPSSMVPERTFCWKAGAPRAGRSPGIR